MIDLDADGLRLVIMKCASERMYAILKHYLNSVIFSLSHCYFVYQLSLIDFATILLCFDFLVWIGYLCLSFWLYFDFSATDVCKIHISNSIGYNQRHIDWFIWNVQLSICTQVNFCSFYVFCHKNYYFYQSSFPFWSTLIWFSKYTKSWLNVIFNTYVPFYRCIIK